MQTFSKAQIAQILDYQSLIHALQLAFREASITTPLRHHHDFFSPKDNANNTLLLMPAWSAGDYLGIKLITVVPKNTSRNLPTIQGSYFLYDATTGTPIAQLDARELTNRRTAAASALAADYLAKKDAKTLLIMGTGLLAPYLIEAHSSVRAIEKVFVWGRNVSKAAQLVQQLGVHGEVVNDLEKAVGNADIISCATTAEKPILQGKWLQHGQHIDLVGSYKPTMREADNAVIAKTKIYIDTEAALLESGDLNIPLSEGIITAKDIQNDLFGLCKHAPIARKNPTEITLFKSVGHALEDLVAAQLVYESSLGFQPEPS